MPGKERETKCTATFLKLDQNYGTVLNFWWRKPRILILMTNKIPVVTLSNS